MLPNKLHSRGKEQSATIRSTQTITRRRREVSLWKHVGKIGADRCCFSDHNITMLDGRHFAHRIDRAALAKAAPNKIRALTAACTKRWASSYRRARENDELRPL